jgi:hypothetical protein
MSERYFLPNDVARCAGVYEEGEWREGCERCLRRLAPGLGFGKWVWHIDPAFECDLIEKWPE